MLKVVMETKLCEMQDPISEPSKSNGWLQASTSVLSGSGRVPQETAVSGSCQQALLGICNSVWVWCLHMGWILRWGSLWIVFPPKMIQSRKSSQMCPDAWVLVYSR
jgi:hypothetical protein